MVINFIVPEISRTGGMRIIFEYANRFSKLGHDVILFTPFIPFYPYKGKLKRHFIKYQFRQMRDTITRGFKPPQNSFEHEFEIRYLWAINNTTVRNADATIATSWTSTFPVNNLNDRKGKKIYLVQDYESWNSSINYVDKSYTFPMTRISVSEYLKELILKKFDSDSKVILNGIDFSRFKNDSKQFNAPCRILFIDHPLENKNTEGAIEAVNKLHKIHPSAEFTCFGTGRYHNIPEFVRFVPNPADSEIADLYRSSDIFLFTSKHEGFGLPPAEAMACKCALVGSGAGAVPEFAQHMTSAILCNPENIDEFVSGASYLINNPDEMKRISLEGEKSVRRMLDWNNSVRQFLSVLE